MLKEFILKAEKLREHPIFASLRDGVMWSLLPMGVAMLPLYFILSNERDWSLRVMDVYLAALGVMGPSCALLVGQFLSKYYKIKSYPGVVALAVYLSLLPFWPQSRSDFVHLLQDTFTSGPFVGFLLALCLGGFVVWLHIKKPSWNYGAEALGLLIGFFLIATARWYHFDIHRAIRVEIGNHITTADNLSAALFVVFSMNILWFLGLQGTAIIGSFITGVYAQLAYENMWAANHGHPLPHMITLPFLNYVFIGGAGTTFILPFLMLRSKSKRLRILGGASLLPCLFNTNESLTYLIPLVFNMDLAIPFLVGPLFSVVTTYYAIRWGLMPNFCYYIPGIYYLPSPLMAIVATTPGFKIPHDFQGLYHFFSLVLKSGSWRSGVVCLFQILCLSLLYSPFYKAFDQKVAEEEEKNKSSHSALSLANAK